MDMEKASLAFMFGIISAVSLPIGALIGISVKPPKKVTAGLMAFGGGALLAALTLELVGPAFEHSGFYPLAGGAVVGGFLFYIINRLLDSGGAFFRKRSTYKRYVAWKRKRKFKDFVNFFSSMESFHDVPIEETCNIVPFLQERKVDEKDILFEEGGDFNALYFVKDGYLTVEKDGQSVLDLGPGQIVGEMSALTGGKRTSTIRAKTEVQLYELSDKHFKELVSASKVLKNAFYHVAHNRLNIDSPSEGQETEAAKKWREDVEARFESLDIESQEELSKLKKKHGTKNAALAIWLGILLDGIPESAVIGASMVKSAISFPLIMGLFMANFPEALSSAVGMKENGWKVSKILWMWTSLMLLTGFGAFLGNIFFVNASHVMFAIFEGCAAGAMLAMIAETMLPEAYEQGGTVVGMSTLFGFLAALFVKSLS